MSIAIPSPSILRQAAAIKEKIEALEQQLEAIVGGGEVPAPAEAVEETRLIKAKRGRPAKAEKAEKRPRRKISAAGRAAMAAAAKARWAKVKAAKAA